MIASVTIVPFGIFLLSEPHALYVFGVIHSGGGGGNDEAWSEFVALSSTSAVITLAVIATAYRFDNAYRASWFSNVNTEFPIHGFCRQLRIHLVSLAPWIGLAAFSSAALVFFRSGTTSVQNAAITWTFEPDYLFEHIGMLSPFVPMVLVPIAFVSLATWWFVHHILGRFKSTSMPTPSTEHQVKVASEDNSPTNPASTEEYSGHAESQTFENGGPEASIDAAPSVRRRRWLLAIIGIVVAITITRFAVAEALPTVRELFQDWTGDYQSGLSQSVQGRWEAIECANELSSRLNTLRSLPPEQLEIDASQRCLDLYFQHRNAPTHRLTFDFRSAIRDASGDARVNRMHRFRRFMDRRFVIYEHGQKVGWDLRRTGWFDRVDNDIRVHRVVANRFAMVRSRHSRALRPRIGNLKRRQHRPRLRGCFGDFLFGDNDRKTTLPIRQCDPEDRGRWRSGRPFVPLACC